MTDLGTSVDASLTSTQGARLDPFHAPESHPHLDEPLDLPTPAEGLSVGDTPTKGRGTCTLLTQEPPFSSDDPMTSPTPVEGQLIGNETIPTVETNVDSTHTSSVDPSVQPPDEERTPVQEVISHPVTQPSSSTPPHHPTQDGGLKSDSPLVAGSPNSSSSLFPSSDDSVTSLLDDKRDNGNFIL
jgi:hypothetical protein